jgi:hypothetical protein
MNKNPLTPETIFRALGLALLLLAVLDRGTSLFPNLIPLDKLLYVSIADVVLLIISSYLRNKRLNSTEEKEYLPALWLIRFISGQNAAH